MTAGEFNNHAFLIRRYATDFMNDPFGRWAIWIAESPNGWRKEYKIIEKGYVEEIDLGNGEIYHRELLPDFSWSEPKKVEA